MLRVIHVIPYDNFVPPNNGGALRCFHLSKELSAYVELTILCIQNKESVQKAYGNGVKVMNPQLLLKRGGLKNKLLNAFKYRWWMRSLNGPAEAAVLLFFPILKKLFKQEKYDVVILEHLSAMLLGKGIKRLSPETIRIVDQHNVDHLLFRQNHSLQNENEKKEYQRIKTLECTLDKYTDLFFACSEIDVDILGKLNNKSIKGYSIPNGTHFKTNDILNKSFEEPKLLFCGSLDYPPNKNGLIWFYKKTWPMLVEQQPDIKLTIIGRNGHDPVYAALKKDKNIDFIGEVDDVESYYRNNNIAIAPLLEGSGTRLKILEAMSLGCAVVSTSIGAEGIDYTNKINIVIADEPEDFAGTIIDLFHNANKARELALEAQKLINDKYSWSKVAEKAFYSFKED